MIIDNCLTFDLSFISPVGDNVMKHIQRYSDKLLYEREPAYLYTIIMTQRILVGV